MLVADTNVLIELFLPSPVCEVVLALNHLAEAEQAFLPRTIAVDSATCLQLAHSHGCSSYDAEFVVLAQQLQCPLLTFDRKLLQLFPDVALKPGSSLRLRVDSVVGERHGIS